MNKNEGSRPATYRELRQTLSQWLLWREAFDEMLEALDLKKKIANLWMIQILMERRGKPTPEEFARIRSAQAFIEQRLSDRLYYGAVLAVMEAMPAGLGEEVPISAIELLEKTTTILGRKNEWLPKGRGRRKGAKTRRSDADLEETRRNQVLDAIGELDPIRKKDVARKVGITDRQLRRWIEIYEWDWDVMELEGTRKKRTF